MQSWLEEVSLLLNLGQTASLLRLREFLAGKHKGSEWCEARSHLLFLKVSFFTFTDFAC